ncbi:hypothetical protein BDQ94DRAFT_155764 [Aspergillus welwitschiae]|uniref:Uncharacterized protein n=1 Tax=Aspergillus welwitschiae TaxID=1341132 RepID=A0A3F3PH79_9EURO|nr:hypothetical protein BDQ94DRAFT_155764 [Aspergillus welwitschiae]RDH26305.1 hypothetical protein BDQ94DRAFT_155764 [Aspergillus welwitschiae]
MGQTGIVYRVSLKSEFHYFVLAFLIRPTSYCQNRQKRASMRENFTCAQSDTRAPHYRGTGRSVTS